MTKHALQVCLDAIDACPAELREEWTENMEALDTSTDKSYR